MGYVRSKESIYPPSEVILVDVSAVDQSFDPPLRGFSIGTAGTLKVDMPSASAKTIPANCLAVGIQHVGIITKIYAASTAAEIVGWR